MNKISLFVIRSKNIIDLETINQAKRLREAYPNHKIICVADCIESTLCGMVNELNNLDVELISTTKEWLEQNNLPYYPGKTGWICGDYVYYAALEFDWDYAWVIEPDIGFINGSEKLLAGEIQENYSEDLLAGSLRPAAQSWYWRSKFLSVFPSYGTVGSMLFGITRASRSLILESLKLRKNAPSFPSVNDESILATVALANQQFSYQDLGQIFPELFTYYSYDLPLPPYEYLNNNIDNQYICHKMLTTQNYGKYLDELILNTSSSGLLQSKALHRLIELGDERFGAEISKRLLLKLDSISFGATPAEIRSLLVNYVSATSISKKFEIEKQIDILMENNLKKVMPSEYPFKQKLVYLYVVSLVKERLAENKLWVWSKDTLVCDIYRGGNNIAFDVTYGQNQGSELISVTLIHRVVEYDRNKFNKELQEKLPQIKIEQGAAILNCMLSNSELSIKELDNIELFYNNVLSLLG